MSDCFDCEYAEFDYFEYFGGYRESFVSGCKLERDPDECKEVSEWETSAISSDTE